MATDNESSPLSGGGQTRREFITTCSALTAGMFVFPTFISSSSASPLTGSAGSILNQLPKTKIRVVGAHPDPTKPNWPNIDYDFAGDIRQFMNNLKSQCPHVDFSLVKVSEGSKEKAKEILSRDREVDGYLVYLSGCLWGDLTETIGASGKPTVLVDHLYAGSGEFLTSYSRLKREGHRVIGVSSSDFKDVVKGVECLDAVNKLKNSTMLVVGRDADQQVQAIYGTKAKTVPFSEINAAYENISDNEASNIAGGWIYNAAQIMEPTRKEINRSAKMYLTMKRLMERNNAQAITVNCLGGIYNNRMVSAYPCMGFMQLDNEGLVGACEADQRSTMTKMLMNYLVHQPGFISDPVIDTAKKQIIYAHCTGPSKMYGPKGPSNPYHIRSHAEDKKGASIRSLMPLNKTITTMQFDHHKKQVIFHQGRTVENVGVERACRTKLAAEVKGDMRKLMNYWDTWGWHRVTYYGDHKDQIHNIADLLGFEVIEEA